MTMYQDLKEVRRHFSCCFCWKDQLDEQAHTYGSSLGDGGEGAGLEEQALGLRLGPFPPEPPSWSLTIPQFLLLCIFRILSAEHLLLLGIWMVPAEQKLV